MDTKSKIILISGPTASGKSNFAIKVAKKVNGEIINADSMQVYKKIKILTARPNKEEQKNIKHHLRKFCKLAHGRVLLQGRKHVLDRGQRNIIAALQVLELGRELGDGVRI